MINSKWNVGRILWNLKKYIINVYEVFISVTIKNCGITQSIMNNNGIQINAIQSLFLLKV